MGDPRRYTEGGFARFNGTAPLPASTAEGPGEPVRHGWNPGGNRRVNAVLHRMAVTQRPYEPRAQAVFADARRRGHSKKEARRILKRHLSDVIYRRMIRDQAARESAPPAPPESTPSALRSPACPQHPGLNSPDPARPATEAERSSGRGEPPGEEALDTIEASEARAASPGDCHTSCV